MAHCHTLLQALRAQGHRITPQRTVILEVIAHAERHLSAEEVFELAQARTPAVNIATVYRTLDLLVERGLASRADLCGKMVYTTMRHGPHIHLVCRLCGHVTDADHHLLLPLSQEIQAHYHFTPDLQHISMLGVCAACQSEAG